MKLQGFDLRHVERYSALLHFMLFLHLDVPLSDLKKKTVPSSQVIVLAFASAS